MSDSLRRARLSASEYIDGLLQGNGVTLARAITVIESEHPADTELAQRILDGALPHAGNSRRAGITGPPGSGKSTFIDALGIHITRDHGEKVAVLSVDPSSQISGGSILGDKTRMERLSAEDRAFIRPSPARGHPGGVARRTRETILLCEAAGYNNVLVETVGVGQSETAVRSMTDFLLLLMIPGAGDGLQGIKRGIIEMLDAMVINKADGDNKGPAERSRTEYAAALHLFPRSPDGWVPQVLTCSALTNTGVAEVWQLVLEHRRQQDAGGYFARRRSTQNEAWLIELIDQGLQQLFRSDAEIQARMPELLCRVRAGQTTPFSAASQLLALFATACSKGRN